MKNIFTFLTLLLSLIFYGQAPQKMSYQAVMRNSSSALLVSTPISMKISILQGSQNGTEVYVETQNSTTNANGLLSIEIGGGTIVTGTFASINWANGPFYIKTQADINGGTNYTITGTSELLSVPYAQHAKTAESISGSNGNYTRYLGELYGGGIVVSVWKVAGVEHGLIASLYDLSAGIAWSNVTNVEIGITAQSPNNGQTNTTAIIAQSGHTTSAAKLCNDYISGGYDDWYLPSFWELNQCYNSAAIVNEVLGDGNGFQSFGENSVSISRYSCSTETRDIASNVIYFNGLNPFSTSSYYKSGLSRVRAVRKF